MHPEASTTRVKAPVDEGLEVIKPQRKVNRGKLPHIKNMTSDFIVLL
jgi:hypothetical protein